MAQDYPFRLRVLKSVTSALQQITPENGYKFDLSKSVFRGRAAFGDDDPLPMVSILEVPIPPEQTKPPLDAKDASGDWDLIIQGFLPDDFENPTDPGHMLMADVKKRLALERVKLNDGEAFGIEAITRLTIGPGTVRPPDDISAKAYFWLSFTIGVVEDQKDPYA